MLVTYCVTWHLLWIHSTFTKFYWCLTLELWSTLTVCSTPKHFYLAHTRFFICSALTEKSTWHELTCSTTTNEFSQALQTFLLQLILLIFLGLTNLCTLSILIIHHFTNVLTDLWTSLQHHKSTFPFSSCVSSYWLTHPH